MDLICLVNDNQTTFEQLLHVETYQFAYLLYTKINTSLILLREFCIEAHWMTVNLSDDKD